jgi:DNA-binding LytR/AlgR family response regulator
MKTQPKTLASLPVDLIIWMEGDRNYTRVHLLNSHFQTLPYTLKYMSDRIPDLVRVHKSVLVNPRYVQMITMRGYRDYVLVLENGSLLPISQKRLPEAADKLNLKVTPS